MSIAGNHEDQAFTVNVSTRCEFRRILGNFLRVQMELGRRTYLGVDFSLSYPESFQEDLICTLESLTEMPPAVATREHISSLVVDEPNNAIIRFEVAASLNKTVGHNAFWGRTARLALPSNLEPWLSSHIEKATAIRIRACEHITRTY